MASLFNTRISDTYQGLIKTIDNAAITATLKELTDGSGNATGVYLNNAGDFKVTAILEFGSLKDTGENIIISKFVDAADGVLNNDNDTSIPTTAAIIDYVQGHVTLQDLDFEGDTGNGSVDLDSQLLDIAGTANQITTVASNQTLTISFDSSGVVLPDGSTATTQAQGDNSTKVATTAYVDILDAASDLDFSGDSGTGDVNLNTQTFAVTGTTNQIITSASGQGLSLSLPATVHRNLQGDVTGDVVGDLTGTVNSTSVLADGVTATTQASSDDSTKVATTAYVKSLNNASDLDFTTDSGSGAVILNSQTFSVVGTANEIETSGSNQQIQIGLPSSINVNVTGNTTGTHTGAVVGNVTGDVVGDLTGNADTATAWETARDLSLTGQATGTISSVDGSGNVSGSVTLDNNSVTGKVLTGLTSPSASSVLATDTILEGFGKLQSQVNGLAGGLRFMGSWDADTNSPVLSSGGGEAANGTTTSTSANKLVDSSASFTSTVTVGDKVVNQVDGQSALVSNVDSDTTLSLDADIMLSGEDYTIDNSPFITQGHYYVVSVGGTTTLNGISNWTVGDWVIAGANNQWTKLDHSQVDGTGTTGNLTKWSATQVIADSIVSESGSAITVDGSLSTNTNLSSTGDFAVNTDKFTVAAASGNTAFAGDLAINTNKFTVNSTTGNTLVAGTLDVTGKTTFGDDITISDGTPILDFEDTNNTDSNWRMEARGSFGGFFLQSFDNNFQTGSTVLFAKSSNGYIGLGGNTNPQAELDITGGLITSENVGIGTSSITNYGSTYKNLDVSGSNGAYLTLIGTTNTVKVDIAAETNAGYVGTKTAHPFIFRTNDSERMRIDNSGNVGIGASTLNTISGTNPTLTLGGTGISGGLILQRAGTDKARLYENAGNMVHQGMTGVGHHFYVNASTQAMVIDSSGKSTFAGIITTTVADNDTVYADGSGVGTVFLYTKGTYTGFRQGTDKSFNIDTYNSNSYLNALKIRQDGTTDFNGNVTISQPTNGAEAKLILTSKSAAGNSRTGIIEYDADVEKIFFINEGTTIAAMTSDGKVGIGTDSPAQKLHLNNSATLTPTYQKFTNGTATTGTTLGIDADGDFLINNGENKTLKLYTNDLERMRIDSSGVVSVATGNLRLDGTAKLYTNNDDLTISSDDNGNGSSGRIMFRTVNQERMRIDSSGNVGIGTNSPDFALDIEAVDSGVQFQIGRTNTSAGSTWMGSDSNGFHLGVGAYGAGNSVSDPNGFTVNTSGNVGIGTTSPSAKLDVAGEISSSDDINVNNGKLVVNHTSAEVRIKSSSDTGESYISFSDPSDINPGQIYYGHTDNAMRFRTNDAERMRIDSGGNVLIGCQSLGNTHAYFEQASNSRMVLNLGSSTTSDSTILVFRNPNGGVGSVRTNGSATTYATSSDYRLKEDLQDFNGLDKVSKIPVYDFKWKSDESRSYGVMAHELQEVLPDAVTGEKDAEEMQGVDYSKIVPLLVKSIQELKAEVDKLKQECKCKN